MPTPAKAIEEAERYSSLQLEGEIQVGKHLKYKITRRIQETQIEDKEDTSWYNPTANTTYICLVTGESRYGKL